MTITAAGPTSAVQDEQVKVEGLFEEAHKILEVADTIPDPTTRASVHNQLRSLTYNMIKNAISPVRIRVVCEMLHFDDKTIRRWLAVGILTEVQQKPRVAVDPVRLFEVTELVRDLRERSHQRDFTKALWSALQDQATLEDPDLIQSLDEMASGRGRRWSRRKDGSWGPAETASA